MTTFLEQLAEKVIARHPNLDAVTIVFPNRRAALYFEHHLSMRLDRPHWAPTMLSIEEYFKKQSTTSEPDRLTLIYKLYKVYTEVLKNAEPFDRFYFWGEMLLRDFDEIDRYLVDAQQLFKDLSKLKELDETFDYLTEEQKKFLKEFWNHFEEKPSVTKEEFLRLWRKLPKIYGEYTRSLGKEGLGYEGMIHREVAEKFMKKPPGGAEALIFAGFNAFTKAEEIVVSKLVERGAQIYWDMDSYYVSNKIQEAGMFMREYRSHPILGKTFPDEIPQLLKSEDKRIHLTGVPQQIGQAKLAGRKVGEILQALPGKNLPWELSRSVIVLPDEKMLLPVMHSLPAALEDINVTMGFPLRETPMFNLLDLIIEMQVKRKGKVVNHREVTGILGHAYLAIHPDPKMDELQIEIVSRNRVYIPLADLQSEELIYQLIFRETEPGNATGYLLEIIQSLGAGFSDKGSFDREYSYHFYQHVSRLHEILNGSGQSIDWRGFQKLFRQVILSQKIPFSGEPLRGLQIMGVLETRNLDFDNVIVLSLNEGQLPAPARQGSYVPFAIRKAYGLPTYEHQDAIYAYLFYRMLQRAKNIYFFFNTEPDVIGNGEMSRYLQQLLLESGIPIKKFVLHNPVHVQQVNPIEISKSKAILESMNKYLDNSTGMLTPSSLNDYIECSLRFYLKHIARLSEAAEVEEEPDERIFGNILHSIMFWYYDDLRNKRGGKILPEDFTDMEGHVDRLMDRAFRDTFKMVDDEPLVYEGSRIVVREVAKTFVEKILERDSAYAPFDIIMLEESFFEHIELTGGRKVKLGGKIDRADRKAGDIGAGEVRIIDYKTGRVDLIFENVSSLFERDVKRNKSAFQTLLYAYVYNLKAKDSPDSYRDAIIPGLINHKTLFSDKFNFGFEMTDPKVSLKDARPLMPGFGDHLKSMLEELFNPSVPFSQTTYEKNCAWCLYKSLCRR